MTRKPELSVLFPKRKRAIVLRTRSLAMAITRILREVVGMIGHVYAYISSGTIRLMVLAPVGLSLMLTVEDASRVVLPVTPEHDVVENYHGRQVHDLFNSARISNSGCDSSRDPCPSASALGPSALSPCTQGASDCLRQVPVGLALPTLA